MLTVAVPASVGVYVWVYVPSPTSVMTTSMGVVMLPTELVAVQV